MEVRIAASSYWQQPLPPGIVAVEIQQFYLSPIKVLWRLETSGGEVGYTKLPGSPQQNPDVTALLSRQLVPGSRRVEFCWGFACAIPFLLEDRHFQRKRNRVHTWSNTPPSSEVTEPKAVISRSLQRAHFCWLGLPCSNFCGGWEPPSKELGCTKPIVPCPS